MNAPSPPAGLVRRLAWDTAVAGLLLAAMVAEALLRGDDDTRLSAAGWLGWVGMVLIVVPTYARRRHPGWALAASMVALYVTLLALDVHNTAPFSAMLCGYCLALTVDRRRSILTAVLLVPAVMALVVRFDDVPSELYTELPKNLVYVLVPMLAGMAVRNRRAYLAALLDRAETAERTREEEAARRVSEERLRIARDVHDVVSHAIVAINVRAGIGLHLLDRDPGEAARALRDIKRASGDALGDLRATLGVLRESAADITDDGSTDAADDGAPMVPTQGLGDLDDLVAGLRSTGMVVALDVDPRAVVVVPPGVATTGYRIVQEALTNVVRHAQGSSARVGVSRADGHVVIEIEDDGPLVPAAPPAGGTGNGVRGMRERAAAVGGTLDAGPSATGWRVLAVLPVAVGAG